MDKESPKPKEDTSPQQDFGNAFVNIYLVPVLAVLTALIIGAIIIWWVGGNPIDCLYRACSRMLLEALRALSETTVWATPYIFAGLAVAVGFKGGLFNIGGEGQLSFGAVAAAWAGYALPKLIHADIPPFIHVILAVGWGLWLAQSGVQFLVI